MSLSPAQQTVAATIYGLALKAGLRPARARELVAAAYAESTLNPRATNKSSGAAGLFQLLSSGYRTKAQSLGGLYDVGANTRAILPNYLSYWQSHPHAAPGEAARDVELSGEGAGFYSRPLSLIGPIGGNVPGSVTSSPGTAGSSPPSALSPLSTAELARINAGLHPPSFHAGLSQDFSGVMRTKTPTLAPILQTGAGPQKPTQHPTGKGVGGYPLGIHGKVIGVPYQGSHTLFGNWESDNAVDIAVPVGTPVYATENGIIGSRIGALGGHDPHLQGLRVNLQGTNDSFYYAHLSRLAVHAGQRVTKGQLLGYSGSANGVNHLHFASENHDPRSYI